MGLELYPQRRVFMTDTPGLGLELDDDVMAQHPYIQNSFPSLWDGEL